MRLYEDDLLVGAQNPARAGLDPHQCGDGGGRVVERIGIVAPEVVVEDHDAADLQRGEGVEGVVDHVVDEVRAIDIDEVEAFLVAMSGEIVARTALELDDSPGVSSVVAIETASTRDISATTPCSASKCSCSIASRAKPSTKLRATSGRGAPVRSMNHSVLRRRREVPDPLVQPMERSARSVALHGVSPLVGTDDRTPPPRSSRPM